MTDKEVMQLALDALNKIHATTPPYFEDGTCTLHDKAVDLSNEATTALEAAIAQPAKPIGRCEPGSNSHATDVLYPAIQTAMYALEGLARNPAIDAAYNALHDAYWSECPAPANKPQRREVPEFDEECLVPSRVVAPGSVRGLEALI